MKCSHLSILAFAISLPACEPSSDTLDHDESTSSGDWGMTDEDIAIAPLEEIEEEQESSETGRTADPIDPPEGQESESGSLSQDESSSSEEGSSSEASDTFSEDEETEESTSDTGDETGGEEESTGGGKPWEIAEACYAECRAGESLDPLWAERDACNEMPWGGESNIDTCTHRLCDLRVGALIQQASVDCRDECGLWRWTDIDRDMEICMAEEKTFLHACYAKYECKWPRQPRQPRYPSDDSGCEHMGSKVRSYCLDSWPPPKDVSKIPD